MRDDCVILDLSDLRGIRAFDPETGVVTIEPGVTQGMLAEEGFVPYRVGVDSMPWLHASTPAHAGLVMRLKAALDPEAVLSPGRYTR